MSPPGTPQSILPASASQLIGHVLLCSRRPTILTSPAERNADNRTRRRTQRSLVHSGPMPVGFAPHLAETASNWPSSVDSGRSVAEIGPKSLHKWSSPMNKSPESGPQVGRTRPEFGRSRRNTDSDKLGLGSTKSGTVSSAFGPRFWQRWPDISAYGGKQSTTTSNNQHSRFGSRADWTSRAQALINLSGASGPEQLSICGQRSPEGPGDDPGTMRNTGATPPPRARVAASGHEATNAFYSER